MAWTQDAEAAEAGWPNAPQALQGRNLVARDDI